MMNDNDPQTPAAPAEGTADTPAQRALAEAEARRLAAARPVRATEIDGRGGLEPVRYGDWEVKGLASDF